MVKVELLTVGKELLIGRTLNTNAYWAGKRLAAMGTMLRRVTTVDDDIVEIASGLKGCVDRSSDFVVIVGGLGPTPDDITLQGIAKFLGRGMKLNAQALAMIKEHYVKIGRKNVEMTRERRKMAMLPVGAKPVRNELGTAPGVRLEAGKSVVFSLPGVPSEMKGIFRASVEPEVREKAGELHRGYVALKLEGILESALAPLIESELKKHPGVYIKSHPRGIKNGISRIELDIAVVDADKEKAESRAGTIETEMSAGIKAAGGVVAAKVGR